MIDELDRQIDGILFSTGNTPNHSKRRKLDINDTMNSLIGAK